MKKLKTFTVYFVCSGAFAFALYLSAGGLIMALGGPSVSNLVAGAVGCGIGTGLANGIFFAWQS
jgi:hypothetical protein